MSLLDPAHESFEPLHARSGEVYAWLDRGTGRIIGVRGAHLAFINGDGVYNWRGQHVGWWHDDHIRDQAGRVALFLRRAKGLGPVLPRIAPAPRKPDCLEGPAKAEPISAWTPAAPFLSASKLHGIAFVIPLIPAFALADSHISGSRGYAEDAKEPFPLDGGRAGLGVRALDLKEIPRKTPVSFAFFTPPMCVRPHPNPSPIRQREGLFEAEYGQTSAWRRDV